MTEARLGNDKPESPSATGKSVEDSPSWPKAPIEGTGELLSLTQIEQRFGVTEFWVYRRVEEGKLHAVPVGKPGAAGRTRFKYPDWEVRALLIAFYVGRRAA